jgi:hypothetical protein
MRKVALSLSCTIALLALDAESTTSQSEETETFEKIEVEGNGDSIFDTPNYFDSQSYLQGAPAQQRMSVKEAMNIPGVMSDPLKAINTMAGITSVSALGSEIMIHGSKPYETSYSVNHMPLGYTFHFGGLHSVISPEYIEQLDVYLGAFDVTYGNAMGGVVDIVPKTPTGTNNGHIHMGLFDSSFGIDGKITDKVSLLLAGRKTYYDVVLELINSAEMDGITVDTYPNYYDAIAVLSYIPDDYNIFTLEALTSDDSLNMSISMKEITDEDTQKTVENQDAFTTYAARWKYDNYEGVASNSLISYLNRRDQSNMMGVVIVDNSKEQIDLNNVTTIESGNHKWTTGFNYTNFYQPISFEMPTMFLNRSDNDEPLNITGPKEVLESATTKIEDTIYANHIALFLQDTYSITEPLKVRFGVRGFHTDYQSFGSYLDPRGALIYTMEDHEFSFATGQYSMLPELSNTINTIGNDSLSYERSYHYSLHYKYLFGSKSSIEVEPYYKGYQNLALSTDDSDYYRSGGVGESYGVDFTLKHRTDIIYTYLTYGYLDAKRETDTTNGMVTMADEIPHSLQWATSFNLGDGWITSALLKYHTGELYTPITSVTKTVDDDGETVYKAVYGDTNSERLPDYFIVNLKIAKTLTLANNHTLEWSFELMNATYQKNIGGYSINQDTGKVESQDDFPPFPLPWFDVTYRF